MLKESLNTKDMENEELRLELEAAEDRLHKVEERNKATMDSIMKLQNIVSFYLRPSEAVKHLSLIIRRAIRLELPCLVIS